MIYMLNQSEIKGEEPVFIFVLPSDLSLDQNYRGSIGDIDALAKSIASDGLKNAPIVLKKKDGTYYVLDGVRRTLAGRKIQNGLILRPENTPEVILMGISYTLIDAAWKVQVHPKPFEDWTESEIAMEKLIRNDGKDFTKSDVGNIIIRMIKDKAMREKNQTYDQLTWKEIDELRKQVFYQLKDLYTIDECKVALKQVGKQGVRSNAPELEELIHKGVVGEETGGILAKFTDETRPKIIKVIESLPKECTNETIYKAAIKTRRAMKRNDIKDTHSAVEEFRNQLDIQKDIEKMETTGVARTMKQALRTHAKSKGMTLGELLTEIIQEYVRKNKII